MSKTRRPVRAAASIILAFGTPALSGECADQFAIAARAIPALPDFAMLGPVSAPGTCSLVIKGQGPVISWSLAQPGGASHVVEGLVSDLPVDFESRGRVKAGFRVSWDRAGQRPADMSVDFSHGSISSVAFSAEIAGVDFETPETFEKTMANGRAAIFAVNLGTEDGFSDGLFDQFQFEGLADPNGALAAIRETLPAGAVLPGAENALGALANSMPAAKGELEFRLTMENGVPVVPIWRYYVFAEVPPVPPEGFDTVKLDARWLPR